MYIDVSAETMMMKTAVEFDSSWLPLLLLGYKGNVLHTLLVDNVNAENMDNADMQRPYKTIFSTTRKTKKEKLHCGRLWLLLEYGVDGHCCCFFRQVKEGYGCGNTYAPMPIVSCSALQTSCASSRRSSGLLPYLSLSPPSLVRWRQRKTSTCSHFTPTVSFPQTTMSLYSVNVCPRPMCLFPLTMFFFLTGIKYPTEHNRGSVEWVLLVSSFVSVV